MSATFDPGAYKRSTREQWQTATNGFEGPCELIIAAGTAPPRKP